MYKVIGRNKNWVSGCTITQSVNTEREMWWRYVATIRGWQGWLIAEGYIKHDHIDAVIEKVRGIRDRIDAGDESVFSEKPTPILVEANSYQVTQEG